MPWLALAEAAARRGGCAAGCGSSGGCNRPPRRRRGHPDVYSSAAMVQAFFVMTVKKVKRFQGLYNYLANNDPIRLACGFRGGLPHRRTFTRRFRRLPDELGD